MSAPTSRIVHHGPKPISLAEFRDAVEATCKPRFPAVRHARPRRIALAVSGGVDSMAMAHLFSNLLKTHRGIQIADNPAEHAFAVVVDHRIRQDSAHEASRVACALKSMGLKTVIKSLNWKGHLRDGQDPGSLPNIESLARTSRYRILGNTCSYLNASSLFFAHHNDDQYETVLMRLLGGHSYRGFQGIQEANDIPECYDLHGVYKSGLLDDQMQKQPFLSFKPPNREMKRLRWSLRDDSAADTWEKLTSYLGINDISSRFPTRERRDVHLGVPYLTPLDCEDGGITIYRPLLHFSKDRLIATCEANKIEWFEDPTNADVTLTPRNAIRQMVRSPLPPQYQKEAVLKMSRDAKRRITLEAKEARRLLIRESVIQDFDPNAGTLLIKLPPLGAISASQKRRPFADARMTARKSRLRPIAAIAVRKLIDFVTPESHSPPISALENVVDKLFPQLTCDPASSHTKAFTIAGVVFEPLPDSGTATWFLSRAPYPSMTALPERKLPGHMNHPVSPLVHGMEEPLGRRYRWRTWKTAKLWDGRFWIRVSACVPARFHIRPLVPQHIKAFRRALPPKQRAQLEKILKYYAPGKVRYSLPALYSVEATSGADATPVLTLLALPSLGIHVPGLERWLRYEARYKWVDMPLLSLDAQRRRDAAAGRPQSRAAPSSRRIRNVRPSSQRLLAPKISPQSDECNKLDTARS